MAPTTLRSLHDDHSMRFFWKESHQAQRSQQIQDKVLYEQRALPANELLALALNEVCADHRRGWTFFLPSRFSYSGGSSKERAPPAPSDDYPLLIFVDHAWSEDDLNLFRDDTHRARYLRANFIFAQPASDMEAHPIQFISSKSSKLYAQPELVLLQTNETNYLCRVGDFKRDNNNGLKIRSNVWTNGDDPFTGANRLDGLEQVQAKLVELCSSTDSTTVHSIQQTVPRLSPDGLGTPLGGGASADHKSRRAEYRNRQGQDDV